MFISTCWVGACELSEFILTQARVHSEIFNSVFWHVYWLTHEVGLAKLSLIASVLLVVRVFHRRTLRSIITANSYVSLKNFALGFGVYFLFFSVAAVLTEYLIVGSGFSMKLPSISPVSTIMALVGIILCALAEELLYRGYMLQGLGLLTRNRILLALVSGFLFMAGHMPLNEARTMLFLLACFEMGFYLTLVTLKSNGLELAIGMHSAHNFALMLVPYPSAFQPIYFTILFPICAVIMYFTMFGRKPVSHSKSATGVR